MGLVIRKNSKWWYGRYQVDGKEFIKNLRVEVRGTRPEKTSQTGSVHFENSRGEARGAFDALLENIESGKKEVHLAEAVYEARAGQKLKRYRLKDLPQIWIDKPRRRKPSEEHRKITTAKLNRFVMFLGEHFPKLTRVDQLRPIHVRAFLDSLDASGITAETWNKYLVSIKTVLKRAGVPACKDILARDVETVHRRPYSPEELGAILESAHSDPLIYSLVVTAACTAMRRKDCCFLRWDSVDEADGFITVKTSKTGQVVDIPMANMLRSEITNQRGNKSEYVFPDAKLLYEANPTAITRRFKTILRRAGFDDGRAAPPVEYKTDPYTPEELDAAVVKLFTGKKREHAQAVVSAYVSGKSIQKSAERAGVSKSTASLYLNELESHTGKAIIRGKCRPACAPAIPTRGNIREDRKKGVLKASVRDFHSFRTTFVTIALMRGMPIDTVRKITGHQTAEIVTKHYFRPEREQLKAAMRKALPDMLTTSAAPFTPMERACEVLEKATAKNWKKKIEQALEILNT